MTSSEGFQQHFSIISKFVCCGFYMKKNVAFTLISFAVLKWDVCLSVQLPFELLFEIPFQLFLELAASWLVQNVNELEFELSRMQMKRPLVSLFPRSKNYIMRGPGVIRKFTISAWWCNMPYRQPLRNQQGRYLPNLSAGAMALQLRFSYDGYW